MMADQCENNIRLRESRNSIQTPQFLPHHSSHAASVKAEANTAQPATVIHEASSSFVTAVCGGGQL